MSTEEFKPGDIVYHKANNLRMVVISKIEDKITCRYINKEAEFSTLRFYPFELTKSTPTYHQWQLSEKL